MAAGEAQKELFEIAAIGLCRQQIRRRSQGDHPPGIDDGDAVAELPRLFHVMGGVEQGHPLGLEPRQILENDVARLGVDADRRLVEKE